MIAHAVLHHAPDDQVVTLQNVSRRIFWVFGFEDHCLTALVQALAHWFAIDGGHDDVVMLGLHAAVDDHDVTAVDPRPLHAVALNLHQVHVRCPDLEQLIERDVLFDVVRRRRRKPAATTDETNGSKALPADKGPRMVTLMMRACRWMDYLYVYTVNALGRTRSMSDVGNFDE